MNKQLELFLARLEFETVFNGELCYHGPVGRLFERCKYRYMPGVPCSEDTEIMLHLTVTKTCSVRCYLWTAEDVDLTPDVEFSMVNATPGAIEDWILSIDFDALAKNEEPELAEVAI